MLQAVIRGRVTLDSVIYSDGWRGYNGLVDVGMENIFVLIMGGMNLLMVQHTLMELKGLGDFSKFVCPGFAV